MNAVENKEQKDFVPTPKMLKFFMDTSKEYAETLADGRPSPKDHFTFMCDKMLASNDEELRVEYPRCILYMGFQTLMETVAKAIMHRMKNDLFKED